jgi:hypothetical protein
MTQADPNQMGASCSAQLASDLPRFPQIDECLANIAKVHRAAEAPKVAKEKMLLVSDSAIVHRRWKPFPNTYPPLAEAHNQRHA